MTSASIKNICSIVLIKKEIKIKNKVISVN